MGEPNRRDLRRQLLVWYRSHKRDLPFRRTRDPYAILVAEVLLQRTRINAGLPYYERFLAAFPSVRALAEASEPQVLRAWEGLGFYRRARNLHRAASAILANHKGEVPADVGALRSLPGIGDYTAGAVGSIAFDLRVPAVDGNAARALARIFRIEDDAAHGTGLRRIRALAEELVPRDHPGEWNQALMELGATVCLPKTPRCGECPVASECLALAAGVQRNLPRTPAKREVPTVRVAFVVAHRGKSVLLVRRGTGLHAGMYALPGGPCEEGESEEKAARRHLSDLSVDARALAVIGPVRQTFSHLRWRGTAFVTESQGIPNRAEWISDDRLPSIPIVPLHRRLITRAIPQGS